MQSPDLPLSPLGVHICSATRYCSFENRYPWYPRTPFQASVFVRVLRKFGSVFAVRKRGGRTRKIEKKSKRIQFSGFRHDRQRSATCREQKKVKLKSCCSFPFISEFTAGKFGIKRPALCVLFALRCGFQHRPRKRCDIFPSREDQIPPTRTTEPCRWKLVSFASPTNDSRPYQQSE